MKRWCAFLPFFFLLIVFAPFAAFGQTETIVVDIAVAEGGERLGHKAFGLQDSIFNDAPDDSLIAPLKPALIRHTDMDVYRRAEKLNARFMYWLCLEYLRPYVAWDGFGAGFSAASAWPGDKGEWRNWQSSVARAVARAKKEGYDRIIWDVWNEPDVPEFWKRSWEQFLQTYERAALTIRKSDPKARITGPSLSTFKKERIFSFLDFAKARGVLPDILNWHELNYFEAVDLPEHVAAVRDYMRRNGIRIDRIMIPETIDSFYQHSPGRAVGIIARVHRAGVEAAAKTSWLEPPPHDRLHNSAIPSLDALLDPVGFRPRSVWWAYREYAAMSGGLLTMKPRAPAPDLDGIASYDPEAGKLFILLGRFLRNRSPAAEIRIDISPFPRALLKKNKAHVLARKIPNTGTANLEAPFVAAESDVPPVGNVLTVTLPDMEAEDVYSVIVSPPK
ncbi:MAG: hypothetical protein JXD23_00805 [Spirochaetales bacterium]|nr:hypothetical protein [Spirochaetales bacterium]